MFGFNANQNVGRDQVLGNKRASNFGAPPSKEDKKVNLERFDLKSHISDLRDQYDLQPGGVRSYDPDARTEDMLNQKGPLQLRAQLTRLEGSLIDVLAQLAGDDVHENLSDEKRAEKEAELAEIKENLLKYAEDAGLDPQLIDQKIQLEEQMAMATATGNHDLKQSTRLELALTMTLLDPYSDLDLMITDANLQNTLEDALKNGDIAMMTQTRLNMMQNRLEDNPSADTDLEVRITRAEIELDKAKIRGDDDEIPDLEAELTRLVSQRQS